MGIREGIEDDPWGYVLGSDDRLVWLVLARSRDLIYKVIQVRRTLAKFQVSTFTRQHPHLLILRLCTRRVLNPCQMYREGRPTSFNHAALCKLTGYLRKVINELLTFPSTVNFDVALFYSTRLSLLYTT